MKIYSGIAAVVVIAVFGALAVGGYSYWTTGSWQSVFKTSLEQMGAGSLTPDQPQSTVSLSKQASSSIPAERPSGVGQQIKQAFEQQLQSQQQLAPASETQPEAVAIDAEVQPVESVQAEAEATGVDSASPLPATLAEPRVDDRTAAGLTEQWQSPTEQQAELQPHQPLNLTLPEMEWQTEQTTTGPRASLPNMFQSKTPESAMGWSGKLYWDESEEAQTKPLNETITGAEVELQIKLP
ncbi:hypothetical protein [Oceanobacter mangrovi]|uniref:hypothetical protein n=1 Tax=Oceanobacter mangrovi TaxID=2862510 RepID=UPI001C8EB2B9|nr:hypothetical protein [Oceanobacter mangrovi]